MALYEHIFMTRQDISRQEAEEIATRMGKIITDKGGKICKSEYWGLRPLAYVIKKNTKAHYTLFNIDASPDALKEMERQMLLSDEVIRFLSTAVDTHEDGPSAPMRAKERDTDTMPAARNAAPASPPSQETAPPAPDPTASSDADTADTADKSPAADSTPPEPTESKA